MVNLALPLAEEKVWLNKSRYDEAEKRYYERLAKKKRKRNASKGSPGSVEQKVGYSGVVEAVMEVTPEAGEDKRPPQEPRHCKRDNSKKEVSEVKPSKGSDVTQPLDTSKTLPPKEAQENRTVSQPIISAEDKRKKEKKKAKINKKERRGSQREEKGSNTPFSLDSLADEVARARQHIKSSLDCIDDIALIASNTNGTENNNRINQLEKDNKDLKSQVSDLNGLIKKLEARISALELSKGPSGQPPAPVKQQKKPAKDDDDDDVDLFGSDSEEEDEAAQKIKEQRLAEYAAKKSKKPVLIAKSNIILDVKPWDDETDMKVMEQEVRKISCDGLIWGASKLVPLAYGIHKLQISCVVEDDKVSVDWLTETIEEIQEYVQSVDIAAFNKV